MGVNFKKILVISKSEKSQNKVVVAEKIGCKNDRVLSKNWLQKWYIFEQNWPTTWAENKKARKVENFSRKKQVGGWIDGWM